MANAQNSRAGRAQLFLFQIFEGRFFDSDARALKNLHIQ